MKTGPLLLPILAAQGAWVAARAMRLPEATGARSGRAGTGPALRLLVAGDSSAAGVGAGTQAEALSGRLVAALAPHASVEWSLCARSGATSGAVLRRLAARPPTALDALVVAVGVNDVKNGVPKRRWVRNLHALLTLAEARLGGPRVYLSGLPPVRAFPLLPEPLRRVLGARAAAFDAALARVAAAAPSARHLPMDFGMAVADMAPDGFHPGPRIYAAWAGRVAEAILSDRRT